MLGQSVASGQKIGTGQRPLGLQGRGADRRNLISTASAQASKPPSNGRTPTIACGCAKSIPRCEQRIPRRFQLHGSLSGQYPQRADLLPASATGTTHRSGSRPARHLLPNHGRRMDLRPLARRRPRYKRPIRIGRQNPAVLRGARRTATGRAGHRLGLRVLRRQRRTAAEPPNKITPTIQNNAFVKPNADPNLFGLCRGGKTKK